MYFQKRDIEDSKLPYCLFVWWLNPIARSARDLTPPAGLLRHFIADIMPRIWGPRYEGARGAHPAPVSPPDCGAVCPCTPDCPARTGPPSWAHIAAPHHHPPPRLFSIAGSPEPPAAPSHVHDVAISRQMPFQGRRLPVCACECTLCVCVCGSVWVGGG
jgi:hypothetical protein